MTNETQRGIVWTKALWTVPLIVGLGSLSGYLANSGFGNPWFDGLTKPPFMPPGWAFGVVWPVLYVLIGLAVGIILGEPPSDRRKAGLVLFSGQLLLNFLWSPLFFGLHDMRLALVAIFMMLGLAAGTAGQFRRIRPLAGALMLPYLGWLCFAAVLNIEILKLNPSANVALLGF
jgi:tryptophan-rich sensory protein